MYPILIYIEMYIPLEQLKYTFIPIIVQLNKTVILPIVFSHVNRVVILLFHEQLSDTINIFTRVLVIRKFQIWWLVNRIPSLYVPCIIETCIVVTDSGACCVFPFEWKGETYTSCIPDEACLPEKKSWCGTTSHVNDVDSRWGYCEL